MPLEVGTKSTGWLSGFISRTKSNVAHVMCNYRVGGMSVNSIQKRQHDTFSYIPDVVCGNLLCRANEVSLLEIKTISMCSHVSVSYAAGF